MVTYPYCYSDKALKVQLAAVSGHNVGMYIGMLSWQLMLSFSLSYFVRRWHLAAEIGRQQDTRADRSARAATLCCVRPHNIEQPLLQTAYFISAYRDQRRETQKSLRRLLAPLRILSNWCCVNKHIHSFIRDGVDSKDDWR